jgi:RNA polymerase sigma-70 factor (ECF subfamily)
MATLSQSVTQFGILQEHDQEAPSQETLVRRALRGDAAAFEMLYKPHSRALYQTSLRILGVPEEAEDALQEGLLAAFRNLKRFEGRSQFSTWLTRIVINAALMRRRSKRSRPAVSLDQWPAEEGALPPAERFAADDPGPEEIYAGMELGGLLEASLKKLSPVLRSAFLLREGEGLTTSEAARALGVSENTLKARLWRAKQQLAALLEPLIRRGRGPAAKLTLAPQS